MVDRIGDLRSPLRAGKPRGSQAFAGPSSIDDGAGLPAMTVDTMQGGGVRIDARVGRGAVVQGLPELLASGAIDSYTQRKDGSLILFARDASAQADIARGLRVKMGNLDNRSLATSTRDLVTHPKRWPSAAYTVAARAANLAVHPKAWSGAAGSVISVPYNKLKALLVPPDSAVSPDYKKVRMWSFFNNMSGTGLAYLVTLTGNQVLMDPRVYAGGAMQATNIGLVTGMINLGVQTAANRLASKGDINPKKYYLASALIGTVNGAATTVALGAALAFTANPLMWIIGINLTNSIIGTIGGTLGGAANINIMNHLAPGNDKGLVNAKNGTQDGYSNQIGNWATAGLLGGATYMLGKSGAHYVPYVATAMAVGLCFTQAFCNVKVATSLRLETIHRADIERMGDAILDGQNLPEAPHRTMLQTARELFPFGGRNSANDGTIRTVGSVDEFVQAAGTSSARTDATFGLLKNEKYLVTPSHDGVTLAFRQDASWQDVLKGYTHARLLQRVQASNLPAAMPDSAADPSLLTELTYHALPDKWPTESEIGRQGWHTSIKSLQLSTIDPQTSGWSGGTVSRLPQVSLHELDEFIKQGPTRQFVDDARQPAGAALDWYAKRQAELPPERVQIAAPQAAPPGDEVRQSGRPIGNFIVRSIANGWRKLIA